MRPSDDCTGVLLAGGKSSRFGSNKAVTEFAGKLLIEHPAHTLASQFKKLLLITNTPKEYAFLGWQMTGDIYLDAGPLAGIHAALQTVSTPLIFVAGCDMPFLDQKLINYLASLSDGYDVVVPRSTRGLEPLHAVYRQTIGGVIEEYLEKGNRKIHLLFQALRVREVREAEILTVTDNLASFHNINFTSDLQIRNG